MLLTQIFGGLADSAYLIGYALASVLMIFAIGTYIIHSDDEDQRKRERNRNKNHSKKHNR